MPGVPGQVQRGLPGRVARPDDEHVAAGHGRGFAAGRAVEHAGADQCFQVRHAEAAPRDARRDDHGPGRDIGAVGQVHDPVAAAAAQAGDGLGEHHVRPEDPGLFAGPAGEVVPADAVREAGVVPDHGAAAGLAAGDRLLQHDRLQALGRGVDSGREASRPGPDDGDIALADAGVGGPADRLDDPGWRRLHHRVAVMPDHDRQPRRVQVLVPEQAAARLAVRGGEPERHVEADEQLAQLVRATVL